MIFVIGNKTSESPLLLYIVENVSSIINTHWKLWLTFKFVEFSRDSTALLNGSITKRMHFSYQLASPVSSSYPQVFDFDLAFWKKKVYSEWIDVNKKSPVESKYLLDDINKTASKQNSNQMINFCFGVGSVSFLGLLVIETGYGWTSQQQQQQHNIQLLSSSGCCWMIVVFILKEKWNFSVCYEISFVVFSFHRGIGNSQFQIPFSF